MWWPRLFREHGEIAWDDYEKDYSDLPEEVLDKHRCAWLALTWLPAGAQLPAAGQPTSFTTLAA